MKRPSDPIDDSRIEAYLDETLTPREHQAFEEQLATDPALEQQVALQRRIDRTLAQAFPAAQIDDQRATEAAEQVLQPRLTALPLPRRLWWVAAAAVAGVALAWIVMDSRRDEPYFEPTPLAQVYHTTVRQGFEPYYECEEPERFAQVFESRQGQPLQLLAMPSGSRMLGLSYPGGLSRNTTAMLCKMDGEPVMVFVDRARADQPHAAEVPAAYAGTHVFRQERHGLVFYEVTPLEAPRALDYLVAP
jgi:hypothetical protein